MSQHDTFLRNPTPEQVNALFDFDVIESPVFTIGADGNPFQIEGKKALVTSDRNQVLGIPTDGFVGYPYKRLASDVNAIVNGSLKYEGAGLLYDRGVAFVQVAMPEAAKSAEGVAFKPFLVGTTSYNGKFRTIWGGGKIIIVCRNTHMMAANQAREMGVAAKHTKNSEITLSVENVQDALGLLHAATELEAARIDALCRVPVTDDQFLAFLDKLVPQDKDSKRGATIRDNKRDELWTMFQNDTRCEPFHTAWSVLQVNNTYNHHSATQRNSDDRDVRNMEKALGGNFAQSDNHALSILSKVLDRELVAA